MAERTVFQSISQRHVLNIGPQATVREAAGVMTRASCSSVLVMMPPQELLGIVTERDLVMRVLAKGLDPERTTVREVMTAKPICVQPGMLVSDAVVVMIERGFRHLPIVGQDGRVMGVFSVRDALPREVGAALSQTEFHAQVDDARA